MDDRNKLIARVHRVFQLEKTRNRLSVSLHRPEERVMHALGITRRQLDRALQKESLQLDVDIKVTGNCLPKFSIDLSACLVELVTIFILHACYPELSLDDRVCRVSAIAYNKNHGVRLPFML